MIEEFKKILMSHERVGNYGKRRRDPKTPGGAFNVAIDFAVETAEKVFSKNNILKILKKEKVTSNIQNGSTNKRISKEELAEILTK